VVEDDFEEKAIMSDLNLPRATFYKLTTDDSNRMAFMAVEVDSKGFDVSNFDNGKWLDNWPEGITFFYNRGEYAEDHLFGGPYWELVSERVRQIFEKNNIHGVQFLPVKTISNKTGSEIGKYWAMNVFQEVEALDWDHTIWSTPDKKDIEEYPTLNIIHEALLINSLHGIDIFRLTVHGWKHNPIFISDKLKKLLQRAQSSSGFLFLPVPAY
jgi:hypothetical protein